MSTDETTTPKRRSSANKRRRPASSVAAATTVVEDVQQASTGAEVVETVNRNAQRSAERKAAKATKEQKTGINKVVDTQRFTGIRKFYNDAMSEIRKVIWPTREQTINLTLLVIALAVIVGALLGGLDYAMLQLFEAIG